MQLPSIPLKKRQWLKKARETRPETPSRDVSDIRYKPRSASLRGFFFVRPASSIVRYGSLMRITGRAKKIAFFVTLGACLVGLAVALNVTWIVINWRAVVPLVLGIIFSWMQGNRPYRGINWNSGVESPAVDNAPGNL